MVPVIAPRSLCPNTSAAERASQSTVTDNTTDDNTTDLGTGISCLLFSTVERPGRSATMRAWQSIDRFAFKTVGAEIPGNPVENDGRRAGSISSPLKGQISLSRAPLAVKKN